MVETSATMIGALAGGAVMAEAMRKAPSRTGALVDPDEKAPRAVGPARARARLIWLCRGEATEVFARIGALAWGRVASSSGFAVICSQRVLVEAAAAMNRTATAPIGTSMPLAVLRRDRRFFLRGGGESKRRTKINSHGI